MASFMLQSYYIKFRLNQGYSTNNMGILKLLLDKNLKLWNKKNEILQI